MAEGSDVDWLILLTATPQLASSQQQWRLQRVIMLRASASEWPLELIAPCHMSALADVTRAGCVSDGDGQGS